MAQALPGNVLDSTKVVRAVSDLDSAYGPPARPARGQRRKSGRWLGLYDRNLLFHPSSFINFVPLHWFDTPQLTLSIKSKHGAGRKIEGARSSF
jgi:hypothetical protein